MTRHAQPLADDPRPLCSECWRRAAEEGDTICLPCLLLLCDEQDDLFDTREEEQDFRAGGEDELQAAHGN